MECVVYMFVHPVGHTNMFCVMVCDVSSSPQGSTIRRAVSTWSAAYSCSLQLSSTCSLPSCSAGPASLSVLYYPTHCPAICPAHHGMHALNHTEACFELVYVLIRFGGSTYRGGGLHQGSLVGTSLQQRPALASYGCA